MSKIKTFDVFQKDFFQRDIIDIWIPEIPMIVLGRFCNEEDDIKEAAYADGIETIRRPGGGGTVFLDSGVLIVEIAFKEELERKFNYYFETFNQMIVESFRKQKIYLESENEFYDITSKDKKVAGVSIAKRKDKIIYGVSIILKKNTISRIEGYLRYPKKQPIYRKQREHSEFLCSIEQIGNFDYDKFKSDLILEYEVIKCRKLGLSE